MMSPNARLNTFVTPNCSVNPTAAMARIEAVTRPNPIDARRTLTGGGNRGHDPGWGDQERGGSFDERGDLFRGHLPLEGDVAVPGVLGELESPRGVVPSVEGDVSTRADVLDLLAGSQRSDTLLIRVDHRLPGPGVRDL